jgi:DNA-binding NarL/FixJ family response regulator
MSAVSYTRSGGMDELSRREQEVFDLVILGYQNKEIAQRLGCVHQTVKNHMGTILDKKGVQDRITMILKHYDLPSWMD